MHLPSSRSSLLWRSRLRRLLSRRSPISCGAAGSSSSSGTPRRTSRSPTRIRSISNDCSTQRNLSAEGRRDAALIGQSARRLKLRLGAVLSSRFCRTRETARLAFGRATISPPLLNTITSEHDAAWRRQIRAASRAVRDEACPRPSHRARHARRRRRGRDRTLTRGGRDAGLPAARKQQVQARRPHPAAGLVSPARPRALTRPDHDELVDTRFRAPHLAAATEDLPHVRGRARERDARELLRLGVEADQWRSRRSRSTRRCPSRPRRRRTASATRRAGAIRASARWTGV